MQTTVTAAEAAANLSTLIEQSHSSPVIIRENGEDVAFILSLKPIKKTDAERDAAWQKFEKSRNVFAAEFEANLAKQGTTVAEFLEDVFKD